MLEEQLRITEIFLSLQGESLSMGLPTVFVRLTACPLRCQYCDTSYAFQGGEYKSIAQILEQVSSYNVLHVTVTGGEPLAQKNCLHLLRLLCDEGFEVSLETSGALDIASVDDRVVRVMDIKTPGSAEEQSNHWPNVDVLTHMDQVKFVICDMQDYEWSKQVVKKHRLNERCEVLFSPAFGQMNPTQLADAIIADRFPVRFQLQLHKLLWGDQAGK